MVQINFAQKQVNAKVVYYGPGMSGKTTNLEVIHQRAPEKNRGDLTSISTDGDRTLFFDFMPLDLGTVAGMRTCFQIYTVPGQVYYNSTRKLVLQGVDGVVFVADSSASMVQENLESLQNLEENLNEYGKSLANMPLVIQYNKRDLPDALPVEELHQLLNKGNAPTFEGIANTGQGVFPTLKALAGLVLDQIHQSYGSQDSSPAPESGGYPAPAAAAPMGSTGFFPAAQGAPQGAPQQAPPPAHAVPPPAAVPSPAAQTQTGFHPQPQLAQAGQHNQQQPPLPPQHAPQQPVPQQGMPQQGYAPPTQPQPGYGQAPNQFGVDPLAATGVHAPPQFQNGQPMQQQQQQQQMQQQATPHGAGAPMQGQDAQASGLRMARPQECQSPPSPHGGAHAPQMQGGATPGGMMQQVQAPNGFAPGQPGPAGEGPRLRPRSSARPAPAGNGGGAKKSAVFTTIFVVGALAVGAVLGRLVLSLF